MTKTINVSYTQFAFGLGTQARLLRESSLVWHKQYVSADNDDRKSLRDQWLTNHLMGKLNIAQPVAERILSKSRTERTKPQQAAYYRAYSDFSYHIIRPETASPSGTVSTKVDEAEACLKMFYAMSKKNQDRFDSLRALDKKAGKK